MTREQTVEAGEVVPAEKSKVTSLCNSLIEAGWLVVFFGVPLVFNPLSYNPFNLYKVFLLFFAVSGMGACWLVKASLGTTEATVSLKKRLGRFFRTPLVIPALALGFAYVLATVTSVAPSMSLWGPLDRMMGTYTVLALIVFFLITAFHLRTRKQIDRLVWVITASSTLVCAVGVAEALGWAPIFEGGYRDWRVGSTISYPIFLGSYLILAIPLTMARLVSAFNSHNQGGSPRAPKIALSIALTLQLVTLILTGSRGPWLGFVVMAVVFGIAIALRQNRRRVLTGCVLSVFVAIMLFLGLILPQSPLHRFSDLPYISRLVEITDTNSGPIRGRLLIWGATVELVKDHPPVGVTPDRLNAVRPMTGYGPETLVYTFEAVYPPELRHIEGFKAVDRAHNIFLELIATVGFIGLGCFLFFVISFLYHAGRWLRRSSSHRDQVILAALLAALSGHLVEQMFGIANPADQLMLWANSALLLAIIRLSQKSESLDYGKDLNPPPSKMMPASKLARIAPRIFLALAGVLSIILVGCWANIDIFRADMEANRGYQFVRNEDWSSAVLALGKAARLAPDRAFYQWSLASLCLKRAMEVPYPIPQEYLFNEAVNRFEAAATLEPLDGYYHHEAAKAYVLWESTLQDNKYEQAVEWYRQAARLRPFDVEVLNGLAILHANHGEYEIALDKLNASLEIDPLWGHTYYALGLVYQETGEVDAAVMAYRKAAELSPELRQTCESRAEALSAQGK
ncbi:O-antigen ligase family protein [Chloroflexota bacterium]